VTNHLIDILNASEHYKEYMISVLVNKLGDIDKTYVKTLMNQLGKLMARKKDYHEVFFNELINLIFRTNVKIQTQYYCISMINGLELSSDSMK